MGKDIIDRTSIRRFLLARRQKDGGFSFAHEAPATLEDTYFALRIAHELEISGMEDHAEDFLRSVKTRQVKQLYRLAHLARTHRMHTLWPEPETLTMALSRDLSRKKRIGPQTAYYRAKILSIVEDPALKRSLRKQSFKNQDAGIAGEEDLLSDLCYAAIADRRQGILDDGMAMASMARRIKRFQGHDGGFSFTEKGAPSFLEETCLAVEALVELGQRPEKEQACIRFVERCRAKNGGFGRQSTTVPTLESTYHAIRILKWLSDKEGATKGSEERRAG
ncbi:MAG: hypothetical protein GXP63_03035 [DPANN group archaeon]|nr:hypothetical protein [DPANN group archaeon]